MARHRIAPNPVTALLVTGWVAAGGLLLTTGGDAPVPARAAVAPVPPGSGAAPLPGLRAVGAVRAGEAGRGSGADGKPSPKPDKPSAEPDKPAVDPDEALATSLGPVVKSTSASLSVAVLDTEDGDTASYGSGKTYDTASIVKVDILVALLLQAQDQDRHLTAEEKEYATSMIRLSDNASADALWIAIGGSSGLDKANRRLGLKATTAGVNGHWGLTQTTAADQLVLLSAVFGDDSESDLSEASQTFIRGLMGTVSTDQDWGVSAAGTLTGLKNGWLPRTATGLWDINSIGRVTVDGHGYLLTVLSRGSASKEAGVAMVERASKAAVRALSGQA
ncbi:hypothetical protein [Streptomyces sp. NPDC056244]|uniref:hypothetical protein n=1 Tax=unclassified Streptomyces TaxID=2593676 RepID=UPI0035E26DE6